MKQIRRRRDGFETRRRHVASNNARRRNLQPIYDTYDPTTTHIPHERPVQHINRMSVTQHGDNGDDKCDQTQHDEDEEEGGPTHYHNRGPNITTASEGQRR